MGGQGNRVAFGCTVAGTCDTAGSCGCVVLVGRLESLQFVKKERLNGRGRCGNCACVDVDTSHFLSPESGYVTCPGPPMQATLVCCGKSQHAGRRFPSAV